MRISGLLQAAVIALVLGFLYHDSPPTAETSVWPYAAAVYAALASVVPWLGGGYYEGEFAVGRSLALGVFFALPMSASAYWLLPSAYHTIGVGGLALAAAWGVHLLVSIGMRFGKGGA